MKIFLNELFVQDALHKQAVKKIVRVSMDSGNHLPPGDPIKTNVLCKIYAQLLNIVFGID